MDFGARTDTGRVRENNEDSFRLAPELNLFVLSDGMGGQASGEVASRLATESIVAHCREAESDSSLPLVGGRIGGVSNAANRLASAIRHANDEVRKAAQENPAWSGMGATVVAVQFVGERMSLAHVGDSRAYRMRAGELELLTQDHSFVAEQVRRGMMTEKEAERSKLQNVLLRALGAEPFVDVDVQEELILEGDTILLCSDGLTRELSNAQIAAALSAADEEREGAQEAAERLIDLANQAGGGDNVTAIVVRRTAKPVGAFARIGRWFKGSEEES
jgi:serine/threonine protein phosphatase PrpC